MTESRSTLTWTEPVAAIALLLALLLALAARLSIAFAHELAQTVALPFLPASTPSALRGAPRSTLGSDALSHFGRT